MFTGIVEEAGTISKVRPADRSIELTVRMTLCGKGLKVGDSVAVNGCCLTAVKLTRRGRQTLARFFGPTASWEVIS